ncbi:MAG: hypothetical protein AB8B93_06990 [Pseudomonadales bacterium]
MSGRAVLWILPTLLWAAFTVWYTDFGGPLTQAEVDEGLATLIERRSAIPHESMQAQQAADDRLADIERFLRTDSGRQFLMVNNIDMADTPPAMPGFGPQATAQDYNDHYMEHMYPQLLSRACHPIFFGTGAGVSVDVSGIDGAHGWDLAALVRYKSRRAFLEIITHPNMNDRHGFKLAAMAKTIAYPVEPGLYVSDLRFILFLVLGLLTALLDLMLFRRR